MNPPLQALWPCSLIVFLKYTLQNMDITQGHAFTVQLLVFVFLSLTLILHHWLPEISSWCSPSHSYTTDHLLLMVIVTEEVPESSRWNSHHTMSFYDHNDQEGLRRTHQSVVWFRCNVILIFRQMLEAVPCPDIHGSKMKNPTDFGDALAFYLLQPSLKIFSLSSLWPNTRKKLTAWQSNFSWTFCFISRC